MKTKEELNALKEEVEALNKNLAELTEEELAQVSGGVDRLAASSPPSLMPSWPPSSAGKSLIPFCPPVSGDIVDSIPSCWAKH